MYLTPNEAATLLRLAPKTLAKWRSERTGPPYRKLGGRVLYVEKELAAWVESRRVEARPGLFEQT